MFYFYSFINTKEKKFETLASEAHRNFGWDEENHMITVQGSSRFFHFTAAYVVFILELLSSSCVPASSSYMHLLPTHTAIRLAQLSLSSPWLLWFCFDQ
jgi:hypothetical protein